MAGLNKEVWIADIQEALLQDAAFLSTMSDWTSFVNNEYINIPQAGSLPTPGKNVTGVRTVTQRADSNLQIKMDLYETGAILVSELESYQLSFDKRQSVSGQQIRTMIDFAGTTVLQNIAPSAAGKIITLAGALSYDDILSAGKVLDLDNVPKFDRTLVLPTDMYYELLADKTVIRLGWNQSAVEDGKVLKVGGFSIYERPTVATIATKEAAVGYQKGSVGQAVAGVDMMVDSGDNGNGNPLYGGTLMNGFMKLGAGRARTDQKGTVALARA
jgi:hypothetical protein